MPERLPADTELLWEEFHRIVNMTSEELRAWLLTDASGSDAFTADPDLGLPELGRAVTRVLTKRKTDLEAADTQTMQRVVDYVEDRLADEPPDGAEDSAWRRSLMVVGHDPLRS